jgi:hypothetical protein
LPHPTIKRKDPAVMPYDLTIPGWANEKRLKIIEQWAREIPENGTVVQIGCFLGRTVACWAMSVKTSVKIYAIDEFKWNGYEVRDGKLTIDNEGRPIPLKLWTETYDPITMFKKYTEKLDNITILKGRCPTEIVYPNDDIDLLFLDANFENEWDIVNAHLHKLNPNAQICGHGYGDPIHNDAAEDLIKRLETLYNTKAILYGSSRLWKIQT